MRALSKGGEVLLLFVSEEEDCSIRSFQTYSLMSCDNATSNLVTEWRCSNIDVNTPLDIPGRYLFPCIGLENFQLGVSPVNKKILCSRKWASRCWICALWESSTSSSTLPDCGVNDFTYCLKISLGEILPFFNPGTFNAQNLSNIFGQWRYQRRVWFQAFLPISHLPKIGNFAANTWFRLFEFPQNFTNEDITFITHANVDILSKLALTFTRQMLWHLSQNMSEHYPWLNRREYSKSFVYPNEMRSHQTKLPSVLLDQSRLVEDVHQYIFKNILGSNHRISIEKRLFRR